MTTPKKRGPAPGTGGRPKGPAKVVLTCRILPSTKAALGKSPGATIDKLARKLKPKPPMKTSTLDNLYTFAEETDCAVIQNRNGEYALLRRDYKDGIEQVRYAPDKCDFYPLERWEAADDKEVLDMIC